MATQYVLLLALGVALMASMPLALIAALPPVGSGPSSPLSVVALESVSPYSPGGPTVELAIQNVGSTPVANVSAVLTLNYSYAFYFPNVTPNSPLAGGQTTSTSTILIDGGFVCGTAYPLEIRGTFLGRGLSFDFNFSQVMTCS